MSRAGRAQIRGRRLAMAPPNGMPGGRFYEYRGHPGWYPEKGVHRDPSEVMPTRTVDVYEARLSACAEMTARKMSTHEIALRLEVCESTVTEYRRTLRKRAAEAAERASAGGAQ